MLDNFHHQFNLDLLMNNKQHIPTKKKTRKTNEKLLK